MKSGAAAALGARRRGRRARLRPGVRARPATGPDAAYEAARWLLRAGHPLAEARQLAQRAVTLRADHLPSQLVLAEICLKMGMGSVARRHLEAALKLDPRNAEAKALLVKYAEASVRYAEAVRMAEQEPVIGIDLGTTNSWWPSSRAGSRTSSPTAAART